tara:strand:+ start:467 stop:679 length:213 start_codon:yes stop_codon:yes gene_type:complete
MRDLKIGKQVRDNSKKVGGCKEGYIKKYDRKRKIHICVKKEKVNPRQDGVRKKETHQEKIKREREERRQK